MGGHTFKITFQQQIAMLRWMIIVYGIITFIYVYFFKVEIDTFYFYVILFYFLIDVGPTLVVHLQYLRENRGAILTINTELEKIAYIGPEFECNYNFADISFIELVSSYGGGAWYSSSEYRYFKIAFMDKKEIIITCLMVEDIKNTLPRLLGIKPTRKLKLVAFIG
jgi:hypothetical protein